MSDAENKLWNSLTEVAQNNTKPSRFVKVLCVSVESSTIGKKSLLVNLTTTQVETLFGELEYIEQRLKALEAEEEGMSF